MPSSIPVGINLASPISTEMIRSLRFLLHISLHAFLPGINGVFLPGVYFLSSLAARAMPASLAVPTAIYSCLTIARNAAMILAQARIYFFVSDQRQRFGQRVD